MYTLQKLYSNLGRHVFHLLLFLHVRPADQPAIAGVDHCHKNLARLWCTPNIPKASSFVPIKHHYGDQMKEGIMHCWDTREIPTKFGLENPTPSNLIYATGSHSNECVF